MTMVNSGLKGLKLWVAVHPSVVSRYRDPQVGKTYSYMYLYTDTNNEKLCIIYEKYTLYIFKFNSLTEHLPQNILTMRFLVV